MCEDRLDKAPDTTHNALVLLRRLGSATDAFLLKIIVEERLGYPVQLISDGLFRSIESALNLTGPASAYAALAAGTADIYPEVRRVACVHAF